MGGFGLKALDRLGDVGVDCSHDHWDLLDGHGDVDKGRAGDRFVLCNHTFAAVLGEGGGQVTRLSEDDGAELEHLIITRTRTACFTCITGLIGKQITWMEEERRTGDSRCSRRMAQAEGSWPLIRQA